MSDEDRRGEEFLEEVLASGDARSGCFELLEDASCGIVICKVVGADGGESFNYGAFGLDWELYGFLRYVVDEVGAVLGSGEFLDDGGGVE